MKQTDLDPWMVLECPMDPKTNDARASSVREYLTSLLVTLWEDGEGFSGKRPLGNSDWQYQIYQAMAINGLISDIVIDEQGYVVDFSYESERRASQLIVRAIRSMG